MPRSSLLGHFVAVIIISIVVIVVVVTVAAAIDNITRSVPVVVAYSPASAGGDGYQR